MQLGETMFTCFILKVRHPFKRLFLFTNLSLCRYVDTFKWLCFSKTGCYTAKQYNRQPFKHDRNLSACSCDLVGQKPVCWQLSVTLKSTWQSLWCRNPVGVISATLCLRHSTVGRLSLPCLCVSVERFVPWSSGYWPLTGAASRPFERWLSCCWHCCWTWRRLFGG